MILSRGFGAKDATCFSFLRNSRLCDALGYDYVAQVSFLWVLSRHGYEDVVPVGAVAAKDTTASPRSDLPISLNLPT